MRLRRNGWHLDGDVQSTSDGVNRLLPGSLQIIAFGSKGRMRLGSELEWHPFDLYVSPLNGFLQRKLRQIAEGSNVVRVNLNLEGHGELA